MLVGVKCETDSTGSRFPIFLPSMNRPTLANVAKAAGVSRSAAARALLGTGGEHVRVSAATRERIEVTARQLHYSPNRLAQQLRGAASRTIGVILDSVNLPVMTQRLWALESEAQRHGYRLLVGQTHGQSDVLQEYVADFSGRGVEAVLCLFDLSPGRDERAKACFGKFRKVIFHGRPAWSGGYSVRVDTETAIRACVDHLVASGKKAPALCLWNSTQDEMMILRRTAFIEQTARHQLESIIWDAAADSETPTPEVLDRGIESMIQQSKADAILATNDAWAAQFILRLQKQGFRIPEDVAIIGFDDLDIARIVSPPLTSIDQRHAEYARSAMELILELVANRRIPPEKRIRTTTPHLVLRESA